MKIEEEYRFVPDTSYSYDEPAQSSCTRVEQAEYATIRRRAMKLLIEDRKRGRLADPPNSQRAGLLQVLSETPEHRPPLAPARLVTQGQMQIFSTKIFDLSL